MATRTIRYGLVTYRDAAGREGAYGVLGDEVDVHEDDLERFDRLNGPEPEAEPEPEGASEPDEKPEPEKKPAAKTATKQS